MEKSLVELIAHKRDGHKHTAADVKRLISSFVALELADYQLSAWLMAVYFRGLDDEETVALTEAMLHSGKVLDLSSIAGVKVDKHSTGGVGDKVSICLAPLVAACGVYVPMVSGRGLGHTGGTLDKLEAIPGFRTDIPTDDFAKLVAEIGTCLIGQTADIAPADKRIYALRDVTATVECIPLIVASILSKKLAEGIDALVLDVKVGKGAFMKNHESARNLANALVSVGTRAGKKVRAVLTRMDHPLGREIGNANETREAIELLHGRAPDDLKECTMVLAEEMLLVGGKASTRSEARAKLDEAIRTGKAIEVLERLIRAQGGDPRVAKDPSLLAVSPCKVEIRAERAGFVTAIDALELGFAAVSMGAGRTRADQKVDPGVGISLCAKPGERVEKNSPLAVLFARDGQDIAAIRERIASAISIGDVQPATLPIVIETIG